MTAGPDTIAVARRLRGRWCAATPSPRGTSSDSAAGPLHRDTTGERKPGRQVSEQGWKDVLRAEGVDDWVVLHGGAIAIFRVGSLHEAAELGAAIAQLPGLDDPGALLTSSPGRLTVRLTRGMFQLEARHVEVARAVSAVARSTGAVADRGAAQEVQVAISARAEEIDVRFWRAVLGYDPRAEDN